MVNKETVKYVIKLANVEISEDQMDYLGSQLLKIIDYIDKLKNLDTEGIEPLRSLHTRNDVLREDKIKPFLFREKILENSPLSQGDYFKIPKVIE